LSQAGEETNLLGGNHDYYRIVDFIHFDSADVGRTEKLCKWSYEIKSRKAARSANTLFVSAEMTKRQML